MVHYYSKHKYFTKRLFFRHFLREDEMESLMGPLYQSLYLVGWAVYRIFYVHGSVHRDSILIRSNKMQQYAGTYLQQVYSTCFGRPLRPSSGEKNL